MKLKLILVRSIDAIWSQTLKKNEYSSSKKLR